MIDITRYQTLVRILIGIFFLEENDETVSSFKNESENESYESGIHLQEITRQFCKLLFLRNLGVGIIYPPIYNHAN